MKTESEESVLTVVPPDGGWGWVIVISGVLCNFVFDGTTYTFGLFTEEIGLSLDAPLTQVSFASSLSTGVFYVVGPIVCSVINCCGLRFCGVLGGALSALVVGSASMLNSLVPFLLIFGAGSGFTFCLIYVPSVIAVGFYFDRWRPFAMALMTAGSSLGMLGFPVIFKKIIYGVSWRWDFRILAVALIVCSLLALTYIPLRPVPIKEKKVDIEELMHGTASDISVDHLHLIQKDRSSDIVTTSILNADEPSRRVHIDLSFVDHVSHASFMSTAYKPSKMRDALDSLNEYITHKCHCCKFHKWKPFFWQNLGPCCCPQDIRSRVKPMYREDIFYAGSPSRLYQQQLQASPVKFPEHHSGISVEANSFSATKISSVKIKKSGPQVEEHVDLVVVPPDGGWGWVVVAAAFICNVITDGTTYSFGLFTDEISKEMKVSSVKISLANSFSTGTGYLSGPFICAILNRYGFRFCGFLGGLLSAIVLITASFLRSLVPFLIVFGFMCGFSFCMIYVPAVLVVGFYFDRWRALAVSLQSSGSSTGMIIFAPIFKCLLYNLTWRWKFRILAAGCSLTSVLALTYLPLKPLRILHNKSPLIDGAISEELIDIGDSVSSLDFIKKYQNLAYSATGDDKTVISYDSKQYTSNMSFSSSKSGGSYSKQTGRHVSKAGLDTVLEEGCNGIGASGEMSFCRKMEVYCLKKVCPCCYSKKNVKNISRPMYRNDIFYHGSISRLSLFKLTMSAGSVPSNKPTVDYHMSVSRVATQKDVEEEKFHCILCPEAMKRTLATMLDFSLMRSPSFMVILFSGFFTTVGMYVPFIYIKQYAVQKGMNGDTANFLLSALGVSNLLGRVVCGLASSVPAIGAWKFSTGCLLICGLITLFTPYYVNTVVQFIYASVFGFTVAALPSLRSVMLVDMLGVERLTNAFGLVMLFQGVACFGGVPIANLLKDQTGSYDAVFIFCGCTILLSAIMLLPVNWVAKRERLRDSRAPADALKKGSSVFGGKVRLGEETTMPTTTGAGGTSQEASGSKQTGGSKKK